jgi:hypothetical protein
LLIAATAMSSCITTVRPLTMALGRSVVAKGINFAQTAKFEFENGSRKREECKRQGLVRKRRPAA